MFRVVEVNSESFRRIVNSWEGDNLRSTDLGGGGGVCKTDSEVIWDIVEVRREMVKSEEGQLRVNRGGGGGSARWTVKSKGG